MDNLIQRIISYVKNNGGVVFENPYYLNLFGIRYEENVNTFNDKLIYYWFDEKKNVHYTKVDRFTTDAGFRSLQKPVNSKGCAILKEGWYRRLWKKGLHNGKYSALVQVGECKVYRDNDKDKELDKDESKVDKGYFGINLHRANASGTSYAVENWSAGCQVFANAGDFSAFMAKVNKANQSGQVYFSYMLVNSKDFKI